VTRAFHAFHTTVLSRRCSLGVLGSVLLVLLAGCGSSGSGSGGTLSHAQLVSQANSLCRTANADIAALPVPKDLQGLASYATSTRTATGQLQQHLSELKSSTADAPKVSRYLAALKQGNVILAEISMAAAAGQKATVSVLGKKLSATDAGALAVAAGLTSCASSS
jgi:hypothetical protein